MKKTLKPKTILKRKRKHGFRQRMSQPGGRATIARRRRKGKKILTP